MSSSPVVRLVHFSDIHLTTEPLGWRRADWFNKRLPGWINLKWLGREHRFPDADRATKGAVTGPGSLPRPGLEYRGELIGLPLRHTAHTRSGLWRSSHGRVLREQSRWT